MRPEPFTGFHEALRFGPGHCPPDLFEGSVPAIVRGLKVHANNVSHARHVALEDSFPRLVRLMGVEAFHAAAERFLVMPNIVERPLDRLGQGFGEKLEHAVQRDLARAEWAWLEAFHAAEGRALTLGDLASMAPDVLVEARFALHPASRWLALEEPRSFAWDEPVIGDGNIVLLTRPDRNVLLRRVAAVVAGDLLESDPSSLITLIEAGAILLEKSHED